MKRRVFAAVLVVMMVFAFSAVSFAADGQTIYLKGSGSNFDAKGWQGIFHLGGSENSDNPNVWHLVYSGNDVSAITEMQVKFTNGEVFHWTPDMGFSTNGGGNNLGWVIVAPFDWQISYVNQGNNNVSGSFVVTTESDNGTINFNISGFHQGTKDTPKTGSLQVSGQAFLEVTTLTKVEIWQKEKTPWVMWRVLYGPSYGSVTATTLADYQADWTVPVYGNGKDKNTLVGYNYGYIVANSNHFTYAKLAVADLEAGVDLALVVGNKIDQVGTGSVKLNDGKLELTFDGVLNQNCQFGAVAFTNILEPKNGNIHSDKVFSHNNVAVIDMPPADGNGYIYLYIHFDTMQFALYGGRPQLIGKGVDIKEYKIGDRTDEEVAPYGLKLDYKVYDSEDNLVETSLDSLLPGSYTVVFTVYKLDGTLLHSYPMPAEIEVGKTTTVEFDKTYTKTVGPLDGGIKWEPVIWNPLVKK